MGIVLKENEALKEFRKAVNKSVWDSAFKTTANEMAKQGFTKTRQSITKRFNISIASLGKNHYAFKSKQTGEIKNTSGHLYIKPAYKGRNEITIRIIGEGIPLILFPHTYAVKRYKTGKVVKLTKRTKINTKDRKVLKSVKIVKGKETVLKDAFVATMKSGHEGIFERKSKARLPILEKKSVSVRHMFKTAEWNGNKGFESILQAIWDEKSEARMLHNLKWKLQK